MPHRRQGLTGVLSRATTIAMAAAFAAAPSVGCTASPVRTAGMPRVAAATAPGWRVTGFVPHAGGTEVVATGGRDAWLAGNLCDAESVCDHVFVRHWDGTAWRTMTLPRAITATTITDEASIGAVAASSAANAWVFGQHQNQTADYAIAAHWTGAGWAQPARLPADINAAVTSSASDAWAFGAPAGDPQGGYIAHFNGTTWSPASFPVQVQSASALTSSDIWAGGVTSDPVSDVFSPAAAIDPTSASIVVEHWDGQAWHQTPLPRLDLPPNSWPGVAVTAVAPDDVWAVAGGYGGSTPVSYLLHWNGRAWARMRYSCSGGTIGAVTPDGHGGVWSVGGRSGNEWFCHSVNGYWTTTAVPTRAGEQPATGWPTWIPGTGSLWALGEFDADEGAAILKYGP
jgi:hypothetical protein